jgi:hypothetical protein
MESRFSCFLVGLFLIGCAQVTPTVTRIDEDVFQVRTTVYGGYKFSLDNSPEGIMNATLLAAAREAESIGCSYFAAIANDEQRIGMSSVQVTEGLAQQKDGTAIYKTSAGQIYRIVKPNSRGNTYACFKDRPTALLPGLLFNVKFMLQGKN